MKAWVPIFLTAFLLGCNGGDDDDNNNADSVCGDGIAEAKEACDGSDLAGDTCLTLGWTMGELDCHADCTFDVSGCLGGGPVCGNWVVEYGEDCDTNELEDATCESEGFQGGELGCKLDCTFDFSGCGPPPRCGNHTIDPPEECDGPDLGGMTCELLGHLGGDLGCGSNCVFNEYWCTDAECGDGVREGEEQCDTDDFGTEDCVTYGHAGGELLCNQFCVIDDSLCYD